MLGVPRKLISNKWTSVKVSIVISFLQKLIDGEGNLVKAAYKHDLHLSMFRYCVYQRKHSQCKQTYIKIKLNGPLVF